MGYQGEARRNPLLAAGRLLRRMGLPAAELPSHRWRSALPAPPGTLFLAATHWPLQDRQVDALLGWVKAGGHLVLAAGSRRAGESVEPLLRALDVGLLRYAGSHLPVPLEIDLDSARPLVAEVDPDLRLYTEGDYARLAEDDRGACLLHGRRGAGRITVLCDGSVFTNPWLGEGDHGELLWRLARIAPGPVWMVYEAQVPGLLAWLWNLAPALVLGVLAVLALALWRHLPRFGPPLDLPPPGRRRLLDHVQASGRFLWRQGARDMLLAELRHTVQSRLRRRHPGWQRLGPAEQAAHLAAATGLSVTQVEEALQEAAPPDQEGFVRTVRQLQSIRNQL